MLALIFLGAGFLATERMLYLQVQYLARETGNGALPGRGGAFYYRRRAVESYQVNGVRQPSRVGVFAPNNDLEEDDTTLRVVGSSLLTDDCWP